MPNYDYKCENCEHQFEVYQSMKDEKMTTCPNCGKNSLRRLIGSGSGLIFKGSGFYLTDYKNKPTESIDKTSSDSDPKKTESTTAPGGTVKETSKATTSPDNDNSPGEKKSSDTKSDNKSATKSEKKSEKKSDGE